MKGGVIINEFWSHKGSNVLSISSPSSTYPDRSKRSLKSLLSKLCVCMYTYMYVCEISHFRSKHTNVIHTCSLGCPQSPEKCNDGNTLWTHQDNPRTNLFWSVACTVKLPCTFDSLFRPGVMIVIFVIRYGGETLLTQLTCNPIQGRDPRKKYISTYPKLSMSSLRLYIARRKYQQTKSSSLSAQPVRCQGVSWQKHI